jgi:prepilin-type N-terminal cleavage/methylation domain-containing protein/prepilin-type processing-associated H-X9-DG protein
MKKAAFTLIELLVVIAIIAILAAILFPVFARARAKAQQTQCLSNMKQIATAHKMYAADYPPRWWSQMDNVYGGIPSTPASAGGPWLQTYLQSTEIWYCPSAAPREGKNGSMGNRATYAFTSPTDSDPNANPWTTTEDEVMDPSRWIMWGDGTPVSGNQCRVYLRARSRALTRDAATDVGLTYDPPFWPYQVSAGGIPWGVWVGRHNGMANFNFCDGHAKAMSLRDASQPFTTTAQWAWGAAGTAAFLYLDNAK